MQRNGSARTADELARICGCNGVQLANEAHMANASLCHDVPLALLNRSLNFRLIPELSRCLMRVESFVTRCGNGFRTGLAVNPMIHKAPVPLW